MFYGEQKLSKQNETALQAVKREKALATVKETVKDMKLGKFYCIV